MTFDKPETEFPELTKDELEQMIRNAEQGDIKSARLLVDYTWLINRLRPSISEDSIEVLSAYINRCADKFISGERGKNPRNRDKRHEAAFHLRAGKGVPRPKLSRKVADEIAYLLERKANPKRARKGSYSETPQERAAKTRRRNARTLSRNRSKQVTSKAEELLNDVTGTLIQVEKMKSAFSELLIMVAEHTDASEAEKNAIREALKPFDREQWLKRFFAARFE